MTHKYLLCWKDHGDGVMVEWGTMVGKGVGSHFRLDS